MDTVNKSDPSALFKQQNRDWLKAVLFAAAYFFCAFVGSSLTLKPSPFVHFWLPSGLYVGMLIMNDRKIWPLLVFAAYAANISFDLFNGQIFHISLLFSTGNTFEALLGAFLIRKFVGEKISFSTVKDVIGLVVFSALLSTTLSATVGSLVVTSLLGGGSIGKTWLLWWSGDIVGILLVAPFMVVWLDRSGMDHARSLCKRPYQLLGFFSVLAVGSVVAFNHELFFKFPLKYILIPIVIWAAMQFGRHAVVSANLVIALIAATMAHFGFYDIATLNLEPTQQLASLQLFLAVLVFSGLLPSAILSERQQLEKTLKDSENNYRDFVEGTNDLITRVDDKGYLTFVNSRSETYFGLSPEKCVGLLAFDFIYPDDQKMTLEWFQRCVDQKLDKASIENRQINSQTGEVFCMLWTTNFAYDALGNLQSNKGIGRDITKRKQMEVTLQKERATAQEYLDIAGTMMLAMNTKGDIILCNKKGADILGYKESEIIGQNWFSKFLPSNIVDEVQSVFSKLMAGQIELSEF